MNNVEYWERIHNLIPYPSEPCNEFLAFMAKNYWNKKAYKALDLGCGTGAATLWLAKNGFQVTSVDCSESALYRLNSRLNDQTNEFKPNLIKCDISELRIDSKFDITLIINALEYLSFEEADKLLSKIEGTLTPNGRLFIKTLSKPLPPELSINGPILIRTKDQIEKLLNKFNGTIDVITRQVRPAYVNVENYIIDMEKNNDNHI